MAEDDIDSPNPKIIPKRVWPQLPKDPREALKEAKEHLGVKIVDEEESSEIISEAWGTYESRLSSYEREFSEVLCKLNIRSLHEFIDTRIAEGKPAIVIDFMGAGQALRDFRYLDFGLAVTLVDKRSDELKQKDAEKNIEVVPGDLLSKGTWKDIKVRLESKGLSQVDLVMCRGVAGIQTIPEYFQTSLAGRGYQLLTNDGGLFVTETFWTPGDDQWIEKLKDSGIDIKTSDRSIAFIKRNDSPERIPL